MARRFDIGSLSPPVRLPNGTMRADARLTRTGVFAYKDAKGRERFELRPATEVFKADSLKSFAMIPITDEHPPEMLTSDNATEFAVGSVGENIRQDGDFVTAALMILDAGVIERLEAGKVELSCGYEVDLIEESGEFEGQRFDAIQTNIRGNHVAIVEMGRAGPDVRIRMDAATMVDDAPERVYMEKELTNKLTTALEKAADLSAQLATEKVRADKAEADLTEAKTRCDTLEGERDNAKTELEKSEKDRTDAADSFDARVFARVALQEKAAPLLRKDGEELELASQSDREIKVAVIKRVDDVDIDKDKSDDYVSARYDAIVEREEGSTDALSKLRVAAEKGRHDVSTEVNAARQAMLDRNLKAWHPKGN